MDEWQYLIISGFQIRFRYPSKTHQGSPVERLESKHQDSSRVHLVSKGSQEVYFEVSKYADLPPQDEYLQHKANLESRPEFGELTVTNLENSHLNGLTICQYGIRWNQGERVVLLLQQDLATYRVIYDPRSPINTQILSTIEIIE